MLSFLYSPTLTSIQASLVAQRLKRLLAMQETWVQSLGWEDPLEEEMTTHSSYSCQENSMDREAWQITVLRGPKESDKT